MKRLQHLPTIAAVALLLGSVSAEPPANQAAANAQSGKHLFDRETFGGNGRTCLTCHSQVTGTLSPDEAQKRFASNRFDPLFLHDGSDDGRGNGAARMLKDATIMVEIPLHPNVSLADDPTARTVVLRRGIPSTLNTPALDPVLMLDGREPDLRSQALSAIMAHLQNTAMPSDKDLERIAEFQLTNRFFSSPALNQFARGGPPPVLPQGRTESEKRGRLFFEDRLFTGTEKAGTCALCHSGPMLNQTNQFAGLGPPGGRFQNVFVSELNKAGNPVREFVFRNPDGTKVSVHSPDPGRALVTGEFRGFPFDSVNAFKIPTLWGVRHTAPYFHDNSAKTLEELMAHYKTFFELVTGGAVSLTAQDQADIIAYMKLLE